MLERAKTAYQTICSSFYLDYVSHLCSTFNNIDDIEYYPDFDDSEEISKYVFGSKLDSKRESLFKEKADIREGVSGVFEDVDPQFLDVGRRIQEVVTILKQ